MELVAALFGVLVALSSYWLIAYLKKIRPRKKVFPSCFQCGRPMILVQHLGKSLPYEIQHYLSKYNPPKHVVRRFICPSSLSEKSEPPNKDNFDVNFGHEQKIQNR